MANPVANLFIRIRAVASDAIAELRQTRAAVDSVADASEKTSLRAQVSNSRLGKSFGAVGGAVRKAAGVLSGLGLGLGAIAASVFNANKEFQSLKASLTTVTGSSEAADKAFNMLKEFAKTTPFQLNEVVKGFIKLKALGLEPSEEALRSYGNTASATGYSLNQFIEAVADASTGEFERLKEFGIVARRQGKQVQLTFQGVTTTVKNNAADIERYLRRIGQVQFATASEDQMKTLGGLSSNLSDVIWNLAVDIGNSGVSEATARVFTQVISIVEQAGNFVKNNADSIASAFKIAVDAMLFLGNGVRLAFNVITAAISAFSLQVSRVAEGISWALSKITFGETSKNFARHAREFAATSQTLKDQVDADADDIASSLKGMTTAALGPGSGLPDAPDAQGRQLGSRRSRRQGAAAQAEPAQTFTGNVKIEVEDKRVSVKQVKSDNDAVELTAHRRGRNMRGNR